FVARALAAVDQEPARFERPDADARALAAFVQGGDFAHAEIETVEPRERHADRDRELRAGAEPDMLRDRLADFDAAVARQAEAFVQRGRERLRACGLRTGCRQRTCVRRGERYAQSVEREPDAAVTAPSRAVQVEKTEMQSRGRPHGDGSRVFFHRAVTGA